MEPQTQVKSQVPKPGHLVEVFAILCQAASHLTGLLL